MCVFFFFSVSNELLVRKRFSAPQGDKRQLSSSWSSSSAGGYRVALGKEWKGQWCLSPLPLIFYTHRGGWHCCPHLTREQRGSETENDPESHGWGRNRPSKRDFCLIPKPTLFPLKHVLGGWELRTNKYREKVHICPDLDEGRQEES